MMTRLEVKLLEKDKNDETLYSTKSLRIASDFSIKTPIVAYNNKLINSNENVASGTRGLNEIYCEISNKNRPLNKLVKDMTVKQAFERRIRAQKPKSNNSSQHEFDICIFECIIQRYPSDTIWQFILNRAHANSSIVPIPNIPLITDGINSDAKFQKYLKFISATLEYLRRYNGKPVMGAIPKLPYQYTNELILFYLKNEINAFYYDFAARNPITMEADLLDVFKLLVQERVLDNTFLYAYNVSAGRLSKKREAVTSKNIFSFGFGFDGLGKKHKRPKFDVGGIGLGPTPETEERKLRLFNRNDYGYYRVVGTERIADMYPKDNSCISWQKFLDSFSSKSKLQRCEALINNEQLAWEALNLRGVIKHMDLPEYLAEKKYVEKTHIQRIKRFKSGTCQKTLT
ncbi:MAG: hypothetical protein NWF06_10120 [Candidatus Bathyarchaeota archaeon]|nr:hypothetical protein [Candidatus Bathyarchaeum sp.]